MVITADSFRLQEASQEAEQSNGVSIMVRLFNRVWPLAALMFGLIVTVAWLGVVGYGLIKLL